METLVHTELTVSLQNYVEAIYWIVNSKKVARAKDIAERMNVGKSSVTGALQTLADRGLVNYAPYDVITLTDGGLALARKLIRRHEVIRDFFVRVLSIDSAEADAAAGTMEYAITETILDRLIAFMEFVERCPEGGAAWAKDFGYHCDNDSCSRDCDSCLDPAIPIRLNGQPFRPKVKHPSLAQTRAGDRLVLIEVDAESGIAARFRQIGAQLGAVIEVEEIDAERRSMRVKIKGYHEQLTLDEARLVAVRPIKRPDEPKTPG